MYLCRCDNMFHPGHFIISQLLSFCISSTAASNSTVFYTSIEILIWLSPLCCARVCLSQTTYQRDRSPSITASLPAFVNPCCATFASRRYREAFCSPSQTQLRLLLISLVDLALSFFLFLYFYLSLYIFLFSLSVLFAKKKRFICLHIYLAKMDEKLSNRTLASILLQRDFCFFALAIVLIGRRQCSFPIGILIVY